MRKKHFLFVFALIIIATMYSCGKVPPSAAAPLWNKVTNSLEDIIKPEPTTRIEMCGYCNGSGKVTDGYYTYPCNACGGDGVVVIIEN